MVNHQSQPTGKNTAKLADPWWASKEGGEARRVNTLAARKPLKIVSAFEIDYPVRYFSMALGTDSLEMIPSGITKCEGSLKQKQCR